MAPVIAECRERAPVPFPVLVQELRLIGGGPSQSHEQPFHGYDRSAGERIRKHVDSALAGPITVWNCFRNDCYGCGVRVFAGTRAGDSLS